MLAEAGQGAYDRAHSELAELYSGHVQNGAVSMEASVHIVTGIRVIRDAREINIKLH